MEQMPEIWFVNLGIEIQTLPRVAFSIFGFEVYWYAVLIGIGMAAGLFYAVREAKKTSQDPELYIDFFFYVVITSIIGARLFYVIFAWDIYKDNLLRIFNIRLGGLAIYGGVIAAVITAYVYTRIKKLSFGRFVDTAAPGLILGQAIGRWGNFFNREVFGGYTDSLFAMRYLKSQVRTIPPSVLEHVVEAGGAQYIQVQPTFFYESVWNLLIFILLNIYKRHKKFEGEILLLYFVGYGIGRFYIEGIRTDQLILFNTGIPVNQLLSGFLVICSISAIIYFRKKYPSQTAL